MIKKVFHVIFFLIIILFFSCSLVKNSDTSETSSFRSALVSYTALGNYVASDEEVERELRDMIGWIQNKGDSNDDLTSKGDVKPISEFVIKKDSQCMDFSSALEKYELTKNQIDSPLAKNSEPCAPNTQFLKYIVEYDDGRISECITSNDRRFGTILFISDPIFEDDVDDFTKRNAKNVLNKMLLDRIEAVATEIDAISQDEINNILIKKEWIKDGLHNHFLKDFFGPLIQTNWNQTGIVTEHLPIDNERKLLGCVATALAQILIHYGYWPGIDSDLMKKMKRPEVPKNKGVKAYDYDTQNAISRFAYDCFISVKAHPNFNKDGILTGVGAYTSNTAETLRNNGYEAKYKFVPIKENGDGGIPIESMHTIVLEAREPILVSDDGHAYIADGALIELVSNDSMQIEKKFIHYNLGWGGSYNGWTSENDARSQKLFDEYVYDIKLIGR